MNETPVAPYPVRLLQTGFHDCYYNMGLDEALLESVALEDSLPVLRFYGCGNRRQFRLGTSRGLRKKWIPKPAKTGE